MYAKKTLILVFMRRDLSPTNKQKQKQSIKASVLNNERY